MAVPAWTFTSQPAPRRAQVVLAVFGQGPLQDMPMSLDRFGAPTIASVETCDVRTITHASDPAWFDGWRQGALRAIAERDLAELTSLDAADHVHIISVEVSAPTDLAYLQGAWALARYFVARGGQVVLDAHAMAYTAGGALPAAGAPIDIAHEVRIVYETDATRPDQGHAIHTRGMRKLGAPDLVALCHDPDVPIVSKVLRGLASAIGRGADLGTPRHGVEVTPNTTWYLVDDEFMLADLLQLNNRAVVLVDGEGKDLMGVAARLLE